MDIAIARALHVLAVVIWIGGISMVTTVVLPAVRRGALGADKIQAFRAVEHRFVWQARAAILLVGLSGFYMAARLDLWPRFRSVSFWWMHAMVGLWLLFTIILFVAEPLLARRRPRKPQPSTPDAALAWLTRMHWVLLILSLVTVFGAVAGSQGWSFL
jgi:uncharacterized membrane protein